MTEEEKKAIKIVKEIWQFTDYSTDKIALKVVLDLIEKLQKENEEYKLLNANIEKANKIIEGKEEYIPKDKIRKLEDMWNDNIWNATDDESKAKAEMIRDVYRGLLNE